MGEIDVPDVLTWADTDRDLTAWTGNDIQRDAIATIYRMESDVMKTQDDGLIENWRKLQTSDHFYYMCTKWSNDGDVHAYFSPYNSPYDAYIAFMNAISDLQLRVSHVVSELEKQRRRDLEESQQVRQKSWFAWLKRLVRTVVSFFKSTLFNTFHANKKSKNNEQENS